MKKAVKGIIGLCGVLAVLGGALAALKLTEPEDTGNSSSESSEESGAGITLVPHEAVDTVTVKNSSGTLEVALLTEETDTSSATYTLKGYEDIPLNTSVVGTLVNNAKGLTSDSIVAENCENLEKYGLDKPQAEAEITFASGEKLSFSVGDTAPVASETYFMLDGENTVYTVSSSKMSNYMSELESFVSSTILEKPADDEYPKINSVVIERDDLDYNIKLEYDKKSDDDGYTGGTTASHVMTEPMNAYLTVEKSSPITDGLFGLTSSGVYSIHPGEAEIAEAGLSDPFCTVTTSCDDGNTYVFLMSEPFTGEDGTESHYAMFQGGNIIYIVSSQNAQWGTITPIDITSKIYIANYVWNITNLKASAGSVSQDIKLQLKDEYADAETFDANCFDVTKNGKEFDAARYQQFYALLVKAAAEDIALGEPVPEGEPMMSLEITDGYDGSVRKIDYYESSALNALVVIDGKSSFFCSKSYVETMIENISIMDSGEDYISTWK